MSPLDEVWHELVLAGVGGRTIEEAKERMSFAEFNQWMKYRRLRGSFFVGNRLESGFALIAWMIHRAFGGTKEMSAFMPHWHRPEQSIEDVMKILKGAKK